MAVPLSRQELWSAAHAEREALAGDLARLTERQWGQQSLCAGWTVHDVVAHLTSAASIGRARWVASVVGARFDFDLHNQRRLAEHRGATPAETLDLFRSVITSTTAPAGPTAAWLGEVVVHAQDIRRPLGLGGVPPVDVVVHVARLYAARDFTVASRSAIKGLRLVATDTAFAVGSGPVAEGTTLALTMAMAGRSTHWDNLFGPGAPRLRAAARQGS